LHIITHLQISPSFTAKHVLPYILAHNRAPTSLPITAHHTRHQSALPGINPHCRATIRIAGHQSALPGINTLHRTSMRLTSHHCASSRINITTH
jgi:hypothetical protein